MPTDPNLIRVRPSGKVEAISYRDSAREQFAQTYDRYNPPPQPTPSKPNIPNSAPRVPTTKPIAVSPNGVQLHPRPPGMESLTPRPAPSNGAFSNPSPSGLSKGINAIPGIVQKGISKAGNSGGTVAVGGYVAAAAQAIGNTKMVQGLYDSAPQPVKVALCAGNEIQKQSSHQNLPGLGQQCAGPLPKPQPNQLVGSSPPVETITAEGDPPFNGGQEPGILYRLTVTRTGTRKRCSNDSVVADYSSGSPNMGALYGPISVDSSYETQNACGGTKTSAKGKTWKSGYNQATYGAGLTALLGEYLDNPNLSMSTSRMDNFPDNYGDPPSEQIAQPAPSEPRPASGPSGFTPGRAAPGELPAPFGQGKEYPAPVNQPAPLQPVAPGKQAAPRPFAEPEPVANPNPQPVSPGGEPSGENPPNASPDSVPSPAGQGAIGGGKSAKLVAAGALVGAAVVAGAEIVGNYVSKDPTSPQAGNYQSKNPPPRPPNAQVKPNCGCNTPVLGKLDDIEGKLAAGLGGANAISLAEIMNKLNSMQQFAETAWKATKMQKVLDVLTFIGVMHNVTMLSRDVAETFGYVLSQALDIIGVDNEDGSPLDINQIVGTTATNYIKSVLGEDVYNDLVENYRKANRIVQVGSSIIWTIRSMQDAAQDLMEWIGENTGKIGNALKKYGVVGERAYPWMSENPQTQDRIRRRFKRVYDGIEQLDDTASSYAQVTGNVLEIQEEFTQFQQQTNDFKAAVTDLAPQERPDNVPVSDAETAAKEASLAPDIPVSDAQQGV